MVVKSNMASKFAALLQILGDPIEVPDEGRQQGPMDTPSTEPLLTLLI